MPFNSESARAAGLKSAATRDPLTASEMAKAAAEARWRDHDRKRPSYPLLSGAELDYWVLRIPVAQRREMSRPQIRRRATILARVAAAQAAVEAAQPPTDTPFALLYARLKAGKR